MSKNDLLKLKNRKIIYEYIYENPGLHLRQIIKDIDLSEGTIRYHINYLKKHNLIIKFKNNGYSRFYIKKQQNIKNKKIISYLRNDNTRSIILFFPFNICGSITKISRFLQIDKKNISKYIKKMVKDNILEVSSYEESKASTGFKRCSKIKYNRSSSEKIYRLTDPYILNDVLISLKNKYFDDGTTDELIDFLSWIYLFKNDQPKTLKSRRELNQKASDLIYRLVPLPFCA